MKTLIFNGSPRKNGNSSRIIEIIKREIKGEVQVVSSYEERILPCVDCRGCKEGDECVIKDEMGGVYEKILGADNIIIVSPVYFSTLTGSLLSLFSRLQLFFTSRFFNKSERYITNEKRGLLILVAGGSTKDFTPAIASSRIILREMNAPLVKALICSDTDREGVEEKEGFLDELGEMIKGLN